ncbi:MAG TPA: hypothetical protein VHM19_03855 [Polyangiales bacterium]|jgi:hypothetical protein|nr:hypothetical protein [Polyangiales bacterium]
MNSHFLIDAVVRQTTVLIAQLATAGGVRAPLAHIANQIFLDLARALEDQGVSRKVSADMFGMALRAYLRKIQRLSESSTFRGRSLWEAIFAHVTDHPMCTRDEVLERFSRDEEALVRGVLHDLAASGLVYATGSAGSTAYRALGEADLRYMRRARPDNGADELLWVVIYREGPLRREQIVERGGVDPVELDACLQRLVESGRVRLDARGDQPAYSATDFFIALDAGVGWEAAVFDHYHAFVKTICSKLNPDPELALPASAIGGSTYTFDVSPEHPLYREVVETLARFRNTQTDLRKRVEAYNAVHALPASHQRVVTYAGQCVLAHEADANGENGASGAALAK